LIVGLRSSRATVTRLRYSTVSSASAGSAADAQALTDNADDPARVSRNVVEVALDYLAVGIDCAASRRSGRDGADRWCGRR
jgi:hypothetical protein